MDLDNDQAFNSFSDSRATALGGILRGECAKEHRQRCVVNPVGKGEDRRAASLQICDTSAFHANVVDEALEINGLDSLSRPWPLALCTLAA
eukprot:CAMPEP_0181258106 /NCGR_PEP_ID=MMETSP1096-20121128/50604_1 /TAXON_ID=156174 ORGANISM="Chrysochromulina ericina, Strain CCMP281" /NCGR_SAMPLE_ID=MMETSP1096 /ASSEMBLY_ACC=CAM_ASM_000453 /LENGTH=90 /DNA_ID=CAMNT_0023356475 /DNA_START=131 /DNA_END=403 /DNA_ORIENTATION=-